MTTRPDEKRPNSTAYGLGSTATESIASSGSETCVKPVDGSTSVLGPICTLAWLGRPPLMLKPPGTSMTLASSRSADWKPPPGASCWSSSLVRVWLPLIVSSLEMTVEGATTSTVSDTLAMGMSMDCSAERPAATATETSVPWNPSSDAETR